MRYAMLARLAGALLAAASIGGSAPTVTMADGESSGSIRIEQSGVSHLPGAPTPTPTRQRVSLPPIYGGTASKTVSKGTWTPITYFPCYLAPPPQSYPGAELVGYDNDVENCPIDDRVYQTGLKFDLTPLDKYSHVIITSAYLKYGESVIAQRLGNGRKPGGAGFTSCGSAIGVPTNTDWMSGSFRGLIPNDDAPDDGNSGPGQWNVTTLAERWWVYGESENTGLVIRGDNESFPENDAACVSYVNGFKLDLDITIVP